MDAAQPLNNNDTVTIMRINLVLLTFFNLPTNHLFGVLKHLDEKNIT